MSLGLFLKKLEFCAADQYHFFPNGIHNGSACELRMMHKLKQQLKKWTSDHFRWIFFVHRPANVLSQSKTKS